MSANQNPASEDAATIREMIRHENELMNHRLSWLITFQGLLFAGLSFAWSREVPKKQIELIVLFSVLGAASAFSGGLVAAATRLSIQRLSRWFQERYPNYSGPDVGSGYFPWGIRTALLQLVMPWGLLPSLCLLAWPLIALFALLTK